MTLIYYLSSIHGNSFVGLLGDYDKPVHLLIYTILAFLFYLSFNKTGIRKYLLLLSFLFAIVYGITDEIHQLYVPYRDASIGDVMADSIGALLGSYSASKFL
jgi:VanZ family protein